MKTLEITIASGTYLVLDLPEEKESVMLRIFIQIEAAKANALTDYEFHGKPHFRDNERLRWAIETISKKFVDLCHDEGINIPAGSWQLIGPGKDHPELVEELWLLSDRTMLNSSVISHEKAHPRIFKNPFILKKND